MGAENLARELVVYHARCACPRSPSTPSSRFSACKVGEILRSGTQFNGSDAPTRWGQLWASAAFRRTHARTRLPRPNICARAHRGPGVLDCITIAARKSLARYCSYEGAPHSMQRRGRDGPAANTRRAFPRRSLVGSQSRARLGHRPERSFGRLFRRLRRWRLPGSPQIHPNSARAPAAADSPNNAAQVRIGWLGTPGRDCCTSRDRFRLGLWRYTGSREWCSAVPTRYPGCPWDCWCRQGRSSLRFPCPCPSTRPSRSGTIRGNSLGTSNPRLLWPGRIPGAPRSALWALGRGRVVCDPDPGIPDDRRSHPGNRRYRCSSPRRGARYP